MRLSYPANIKVIRVPCSGKVDVLLILKAFEKGADGVYIVGCEEGECHYLKGNFRAKKRVDQAKRILDSIGMDGERVRMFNLSSGEGPRFAAYAEEMTRKIHEMGPSPIKRMQKAKAA